MQSGIGRNVFAKSAQLVVRNPVLLAPGLITGAIAAALEALVQPPGSLDGDAVRRFAADVVVLVATLTAVALTTGMANAAWRTERATFADGARGVTAQSALVWLALLAAGVAAAALAPLTLGLSYFVYMCAFVYAPAAAISGGHDGLAAVRESIAMFLARTGPTILIIAAIVIVSTVMSVFAEIVAGAPFVGPLIAAIVLQTVAAYVSTVIVGEYRLLRNL